MGSALKVRGAILGLISASILVVQTTAAQTTATIEGVVVNSVTGVGVAGITVKLVASKETKYQAVSDASGAFRATGISPGEYQVRLEKPQLVETLPQLLRVEPGLRTVRLEMTARVTLRGRVVDNDGNPIRGVSVALAQGVLGTSVDAITAEEGEFTFDNVAPGPYMLIATPAPPKVQPAAQSSSNPSGPRIGPVRTFYPSAIDPSAAQRILVRGDSNLFGNDIRLQTAPVYRIRGVVLDESGKPAPGVQVALRPRPVVLPRPLLVSNSLLSELSDPFIVWMGPGSLDEDQDHVQSREDGFFEFLGVPSGDWLIRAETDTRPGPKRIGTASTLVGRTDVDDLRVQVQSSLFPVTVALDWGGAPVPDPKPTILLVPDDAESPFPELSDTRPDGTLRIENVSPGRYYLGLQPVPGFYPTSVLVDGRETGQPIGLYPGSPPIRIVYKAATGSVSGMVEKGGGATVVLLPRQVQIEGTGRIARCAPDGTFEITGVAPGEYFASAFEQFDASSLYDPALLNKISSSGARVKVEQDFVTIALKPIRWPE